MKTINYFNAQTRPSQLWFVSGPPLVFVLWLHISGKGLFPLFYATQTADLRIGLPFWNTFISSLLENDELLWAIDQIKMYKITHNLYMSNSKAIRLLLVKKDSTEEKHVFIVTWQFTDSETAYLYQICEAIQNISTSWDG